jgi:hypothetical protein
VILLEVVENVLDCLSLNDIKVVGRNHPLHRICPIRDFTPRQSAQTCTQTSAFEERGVINV